MQNPVIAEVYRGGFLESQHRGCWAVSDATGQLLCSGGDFSQPIFPRSAIKAFQCLPLIDSGAADRFGFSDHEIALACASHSGEVAHVQVAESMLAKSGAAQVALECGAHWPLNEKARIGLAQKGVSPSSLHNNCSGKHAGMLATCHHCGFTIEGYVDPAHAMQKMVAKALSDHCHVRVEDAPRGTDGCSLPTWALPLSATASGFARLAHSPAGSRIISAVCANPFYVAGTGRFDTRVMQAVPRLFIKMGAEGVHAGVIAHAGLGFAMKCWDGASRAAEVAVAALLLSLNVWRDDEQQSLRAFTRHEMKNWRGLAVGEVRAAIL